MLECVSWENHAVILKFGLEIKNHCIARAIIEGFPAVIPKLTPSNQESLHAGVCFFGKSCSDSQVWA